VLLSVARFELAARNFAEARRHINRALTLEPRSSEILFVLATLENAEGNSTAAVAALQKARALTPESPTILAQLVLTAIRAHQSGLAAEAARDLLTRKPDDSEALYLFGAASLQNGSLVSARDALERFVKQQPNDPRGCLALGITIAAQKESLQAARSQFERCLQIDATNIEAKYQLGLLSKSEGETANAIKLFEEVIARAPDHANALRDLGSLFLQSNEAAKARAVLERAVALNAQDAETHFLLSRVYSRVGENALASRHLELFQKLKSQREKPSAP
jgi:Flp pilus assembly protein TadD